MSPERNRDPEDTLQEAIKDWPKERLAEGFERLQKCERYGPELDPSTCRIVIVAPGDIGLIPHLVQDSCNNTQSHNLMLFVNYVDNITDTVKQPQNQLEAIHSHLSEFSEELTQPVLLYTEKYSEQQPIQEIRKHATDIALTHFLNQNDNGHPMIMICNDADSRIPNDYVQRVHKQALQNPTRPHSGAIKYTIDSVPDLHPVNQLLSSLSQTRQQWGMTSPANVAFPVRYYLANNEWGEREAKMTEGIGKLAPRPADLLLEIEVSGRRELYAALMSGQMTGVDNRGFTTENRDPVRSLDQERLVSLAEQIDNQAAENIWRQFVLHCIDSSIKGKNVTNSEQLNEIIPLLCDAPPFNLTPAQDELWRQELMQYGRDKLQCAD